MKLKTVIPLFILIISQLVDIPTIEANDLSLDSLPFKGYYIAPEESGIEGLLFQDNQLIVYIKDVSRYAHSEHEHDHNQENVEKNNVNPESEHAHENHSDLAVDQEFIEWLFQFNSFPYPDLQAYSTSVQERYKEENNLPTDLKKEYLAITEKITPEMTQRNILDLINQTIPNIFYTHKNNYNYFIISCPTVTKNNKEWIVELFGEEIFIFSQDEGKLLDNHGNTYEYVDGITPN
ncbi:hypothetical protein [Facklamia sp. 7083-14-GEN3]|uniref:hypothetical protein n=1 Tax=Facklamia sp. 7083-14-GEN3 TaxID=2973478 RepID=UPI00215D54E8|nr:hypothetical protein [Facklamia sp. 7083-14-GEN3]MCR8968484.1 hypothetical protein [Facklamia sp. 7083-14-GEN3]